MRPQTLPGSARDPAEPATPGVCGRDYLNSRVAFRQMLATARFMQ
jgi:hypothetical protein